ncbi:MAG: folP [Rariglobus sp.]|jgi:dihydropteroate synthase|nr:folP [Rariglobus sp.]
MPEEWPQNSVLPRQAMPAARELLCRDRRLLLDGTPHVVGILNVTDDSFFDGGQHNSLSAAVSHARLLVAEGASVIDIGGQSTRPGYVEVGPDEEIRRVIPVIRELVRHVAVPLSIDTYHATVADAALQAGAHIVNDVHGLQHDPAMAPVIARHGAAAILMHNDPAFRETPGDVIENIKSFLTRSLALAAAAGIDPARIILDPGIGFGKTQPQNLAILARLSELHALGHPILLGASRKSVISHVLDLPPDERLEGTLALTALAVGQGVQFHRVHDVRANHRAALMSAAIRDALASGSQL